MILSCLVRISELRNAMDIPSFPTIDPQFTSRPCALGNERERTRVDHAIDEIALPTRSVLPEWRRFSFDR